MLTVLVGQGPGPARVLATLLVGAGVILSRVSPRPAATSQKPL